LGLQAFGEDIQIVGVANEFAILNPISGELVTAFVVTGGKVVIPEAFIDRLTITKLRAADGSLAFENGKLRADLIETNQLIVSLDNVSDGYLRRGELWPGVKVKGGDSIGYIQDRAREGGTSYDRVKGWTRTGTTLIDGGSIYADDAFIVRGMFNEAVVGTLQLEGEAVIAPRQFWERGNISVNYGEWATVGELNLDNFERSIPCRITVSMKIGFSSTEDQGRYHLRARFASDGYLIGELNPGVVLRGADNMSETPISLTGYRKTSGNDSIIVEIRRADTGGGSMAAGYRCIIADSIKNV